MPTYFKSSTILLKLGATLPEVFVGFFVEWQKEGSPSYYLGCVVPADK